MNLRITTKNLTLSDEARGRIERRVYFALGRFSGRIRSVDLTLWRDNGRRGGAGKCCRILIKSRRAKDVMVEGRGEDVRSLVDRTTDRAGRAVARALDVRPRRNAGETSGKGSQRGNHERSVR